MLYYRYFIHLIDQVDIRRFFRRVRERSRSLKGRRSRCDGGQWSKGLNLHRHLLTGQGCIKAKPNLHYFMIFSRIVKFHQDPETLASAAR